ncbi:MAG: protoporphyrinogen oxidase HemJ [Panacagrimonas sp.]
MLLWIKAFHVIFMVTWFAGLFYLPRLFIYHLEAKGEPEHQRFCTMERKLYALMTIGMVLTWAFGVWLITLYPAYMQMGWLHAKLAMVIALSGYHGWLKVNLRKFAAGTNTRSGKFWRWANEVPALVLIAVVILVIVKPF